MNGRGLNKVNKLKRSNSRKLVGCFSKWKDINENKNITGEERVTWKLKCEEVREERGTKLSFGRATRGCKPNGVGSLHVSELTQTPINTLSLSYIPTTPHDCFSLYSLPSQLEPQCLTINTPTHPLYLLHLLLKTPNPQFDFDLRKQTQATQKEKQIKWLSENQTDFHKQLCWSKFSRGAQAWGRNSNTMTNKASLWMSPRAILWFMSEKTEADTLSQSPSWLALSSKACFIKQKKNLDLTTTWVSQFLVKKLLFSH